MPTFIALLRGINVGGQRIIKMAELRKLLESLDFSEVTTYIQSGNVIFESNEKSEEVLQTNIQKAILSYFGFEVPVLVMNRSFLKIVMDKNPFLKKLEQGIFEEQKMYYTLLSEVKDPQILGQLKILPADGEEYHIAPTDKVVYFYAAKGYGSTKLTNNFFEKKLNCRATTRNLKTLTKLLTLSAPNF